MNKLFFHKRVNHQPLSIENESNENRTRIKKKEEILALLMQIGLVEKFEITKRHLSYTPFVPLSWDYPLYPF